MLTSFEVPRLAAGTKMMTTNDGAAPALLHYGRIIKYISSNYIITRVIMGRGPKGAKSLIQVVPTTW